MTIVISVSEARATLPELLDRVSTGEEVTITRHGRPTAVLVRPDTLRARRAEGALSLAASLREAIERGRQSRLSTRPRLDLKRAEAHIEEIRSARSRP